MYLLAWALRRSEQTAESRDWLRRAESLGGAVTAAGDFFHAQAVVRTEPDKAVAAYRDAIHKKKNYAQACIHLGRAHNHWMYHHRNQERFVEQQTYLTMACDMQPGKAYPRYLLSIANRLSAEIYEANGDRESAEKRYEAAFSLAKQAQETEPDSPLGFACEAEYWEVRRDYTRAIACRDREAAVCKTSVQRIDMYLYRWRLLYWDGQLDRAVDDMMQLQNLCPESDPRKIWCAGLFPALVSAERGDADAARRMALRMAEGWPTDFRAVTSTAAVLRLLGHGDLADSLLTKHAGQVVLESNTQSMTPPGWNEAVYTFRYYEKDLAELEPRAGDRRADLLLWSAPRFFAGAAALGQADRTAALQYFTLCEKTFDYDDWCYLGRLFVRKLESDSSWPPWLPGG
jgi:tetratricopeptide (TPR) repeat protein